MAIFTALAATLASVLVSAGMTTAVAAAVANIVVGVGTALISSLLAPKPPRLKTPDVQVVLNQATGGRVRGYGKMKIGGTRAFFDSKNGRLYQIIVVHHGQIDSFEKFWIGDKPVDLGEDGWVNTLPFGGDQDNVRIESRVGTDDSTAYAPMLSAWPGKWTTDHRLRGLATIYAEFVAPPAEDFSKVFPESHNTAVTAVAKLSLVYDPRDGTTGYSSNCSLCIRDYLVHPDGFPGIGAGDVYDPDFAAFADICDEDVPLKAGGTVKRYRLGGLYSLQDDPVDVLARMLAACDGELYERADGKIGIRGGAWIVPPGGFVTITDRDWLAFEMEEGADKFAAFNELKIVFCDPDHDYQATEAPKWVNATDQALRGAIVEDLTFDMVPSPSQAQRLAKIHQHKRNPRWRGTLSTSATGLLARGERIIRIVIPELNLDDTFLVETHGIRGDLTGCELAVVSLGPEAYAWDPATEEGEASPPPDDTSPDLELEVPVGLELAVEHRTVGIVTTAAVVVATVDPPARTGMQLGGQIRIVSPPGPWLGMVSTSDSLEAVSGIVSDGETYEVRCRWRAPSDVVSAWCEPVSIAV